MSDTARRPISTTAPAVGTASSGPETRAPQAVVLLALERLGVGVGHGDVGAGGGEGEGDGAADAAGAAGDEGDAAGEGLGIQHGRRA